MDIKISADENLHKYAVSIPVFFKYKKSGFIN